MEFADRKPNRLSGHDYNTNGVYFVTICTQDREKILSDIVGDDAHIVPKPDGLVVEKYIRNVPEIIKYVIMPDHVHLMIQLENGAMWASPPTSRRPQQNRISTIVRSIKVLVTKEIGRSIFQRSYYDHVIRNQQDFDAVWQYSDRNPLKWALANRDT